MVVTGQKTGDDVTVRSNQLNIYVVQSEIQSKIDSHLSMGGILMTMKFDDMEMVFRMVKKKMRRSNP